MRRTRKGALFHSGAQKKIFLEPCRLTETEIAAGQQYFVIMGPEGDASLPLITARM
jgi:hypothetical protein